MNACTILSVKSAVEAWPLTKVHIDIALQFMHAQLSQTSICCWSGSTGSKDISLTNKFEKVHLRRGNKRTIVIDGSDEIAGGGLVAHPCIGDARRMSVAPGATQAYVALEAVQNLTAQVTVASSFQFYPETPGDASNMTSNIIWIWAALQQFKS